MDIRGVKIFLLLFQKLWFPLFIPAITLLMTASLVTAFSSWLKQKVLDSKEDI